MRKVIAAFRMFVMPIKIKFKHLMGDVLSALIIRIRELNKVNVLQMNAIIKPKY